MNQPNGERQHLKQQQQEGEENDDNRSIVGVNSSSEEQGWSSAEELDKVKEEMKILGDKLKTAEQKAQVAKNEDFMDSSRAVSFIIYLHNFPDAPTVQSRCLDNAKTKERLKRTDKAYQYVTIQYVTIARYPAY